MKQQAPTLALKDYPNRLIQRDYVWQLFTPFKDTSDQPRIRELLEEDCVGEAQPYILDDIKRKLYWKNLLVEREINGERLLCWRCEALQEAGKKILEIKKT